jgi:hypothetical protein
MAFTATRVDVIAGGTTVVVVVAWKKDAQSELAAAEHLVNILRQLSALQVEIVAPRTTLTRAGTR